MRLPSSPRCLITGAGSGLGRELALQLAARRAHLVVADRNLATATATAEMALKAGAASARPDGCDVSQAGELERLAQAMSGEGGIDLLVNNAGVATGGRVGELTLGDWRWTLDVDLYGVIYGCHFFVPLMRQQGRGHILNVASAAGLLSAPRMAAYNVAKAGVISLTETLAGELHGSGVGVTVLCPTFFKTAIIDSGHFADGKSKQMADKMMSRATEVAPVAKAALDAVEAGQLYCIPHGDGRWMWRLKRLAPSAYRDLSGRIVSMMSKRA